MKDKHIITPMQFDSLVSKVFRQEKASYMRMGYRRKERECIFSDLTASEKNSIYAEDKYFENEFKTITVARLEANIKDALLYEALEKLKPREKEVIVLKFWHDMSDEEIGKELNIKRSTVNYSKNSALKTLKKIIEEMMGDD